MSEVTAPGSGEAAARATEENAFYHEAALNAAWTGSRLALGGLSFLFGAFAFAYFYLQSANGHSLWLPKSNALPQIGYGVAIMVLIVVSAVVQTVGLQRIKAGRKGPWATLALVALVLGLVAVALQIVQLLEPAVPARPVRFRQRLRRVLPGGARNLASRHDLAGDPHRSRTANPGDLIRGAAAYLRADIRGAAVPVVAECFHPCVELPRHRGIHLLAVLLCALSWRPRVSALPLADGPAMFLGGSILSFVLPMAAFIVIAGGLFWLYRRPHSNPRLKYLEP